MNLSIALSTAFLVTLTLMPIIIKTFRSFNLLDVPDNRKIHSVGTPTLGGIAIFTGLIIAILFSSSLAEISSQKYLLAGIFLLFLLGVRDDISSLYAHQKLIVQVFAAFLVVYLGQIKFHGLEGLMGISDFPWYWNEIFSVVVIVVMTNSFNLIDGIDGLAGTVTLIVSGFFTWFFVSNGFYIYGIISITLVGSTLAFLLYNWHPSKVFMGDTGSMTIGFLLTVLLILYFNVHAFFGDNSFIEYPVAVGLSLLFLPFFDTLRVFTIRVLNKKHPLSPDRNHIHHVLLRNGLNHAKATIGLGLYNIVLVLFSLVFNEMGNVFLISTMIVVSLIISSLLDFRSLQREKGKIAELESTTPMKISRSA